MKRKENGRAIARDLLVLLVLILALWIFWSPLMHWLACQQLAPVERLFTRGC